MKQKSLLFSAKLYRRQVLVLQSWSTDLRIKLKARIAKRMQFSFQFGIASQTNLRDANRLFVLLIDVA